MIPRLCLFGPPTLHAGDASWALPPERRSQLLVVLALKRAWVGRAELAAMLWPQLPQKLAFGNLRKTLFRLQPLPWGAAVELQGGTLRFEAQTDVFEFDRAWRERDFRAAVELRRAELLQGFDDDDNEAWSSWLAVERERLRVAWREAALHQLGAGIEPAEGVQLSRRLLELDPLDEAALRAHMQCLAQAGQPAQARQAYRAFAARLRQELGVTPGVELKALHDALGAPATRAGMPAPPAASDEDDFIGRALELRQLREMLSRPPCRMLTLVGPGGVGKSRLARRALRELAPQFADGAEFVALEDIVSPGEVIGRVAQDLGLQLGGGRDALAVVSEHLRARELLLVLDNFEHVVPALAVVERLAQACPRLKLLVTSRVRLGHAMEWMLPLGGLPCPEPADLDRLEAFDAARLFIQTSRRVEPALAVAAEAAAIAEICRLVEGLPLALELAATWTRVLSCGAIAAELREGTALLSAGAGAHPPRHASFERVFEQTWRLLGESERSALARLSVFSGGFTAEAARAVADVAPALLGGLADKSLLRKEGTRLSMHPLVQQLAAQRLDTIEATPATRSAHASYYLRWLTQLRRPVEDGQREAMEWVDTECDNCRAALHWSITHEGVAAAARSVATLTHFCDHRARIDEGLAMLRAILDSQGEAGEPRLTALLLSATAQLQYRLDRYDEALTNASRAIAEGGAVPDGETRLQALKVLGSCHLRLGRLADAERFFRQALQDAPASVDPRHAATMMDHLARVASGLGRRAEARRLAMRSLLQHRRLGDVAGEALCLDHLGELMLDGGDAAAAEAHLKEGLAICECHGLVGTRGLLLAKLAETALLGGDAEAAERQARLALGIAEAAGNRTLAASLKLQFFRLALRRGDLAGARAELAAAAGAALALARPALQLQVASCFADLLAQQREPGCARAVQAIAAAHPAAGVEPRPSPAPPSPDIGLDELLHRIALEAGLAHAPLIAALRAA